MSGSMRFSTALREFTRKQIEQLGKVDLIVGIPAYYSDDSIDHVIRQVVNGLQRFYPDLKSLIMIADGGSTDDTREVAQQVDAHQFNLEIIVTIYRGMPGKGTAFRAIFEAASFLKAQAVAVFDSDLKSIHPGWVRNIIEPVLDGYDFVAPDYARYKYDGTITNTIAYNLTRALYGVNIRQPIGGDFGISRAMIKHYLEQDVWETDIAKFGVDIWMTTTAITGGFRICQTRLGAKIHGEKDPAADLGPMFRQVVGTIFKLMELNAPYWKKITTTTTPPIIGEAVGEEPTSFDIDQTQLIEYFLIGFQNFGTVWQNIIDPDDYDMIIRLASAKKDGFHMPSKSWIRIVYRYAYQCCQTPRQTMKLLDTLIPLYYGRVASLINDLANKNHEEAESYFDAQARIFEEMKPYLIGLWDKMNTEKA